MLSPSKFLPRAGLMEQIQSAVREYPLTTVVAPMGYGKTTLAQSIAETTEGAAYYYAVPAGPHDAPFLWHDMFSRFEAQGMPIAPAMIRLGLPETASQWRHALELLCGQTAPTLLILDDCHMVTDTALFAFWERAVRENAPHFRLALFSRTRPPLSLEELRIKGYAAVFEQNFLAFSAAETEEYFRLNGVADVAAAAEAHKYSEGWPAALWLCLQSWRACGRIIESQNINSLLETTVFAAYSPEERDLLMRLSVLETFTEQDAGKLAASPDHAATLRTLREKNPFLSLDAKTGRYQFHSIFREFLDKELALAAHIDKPPLYRLAGECCREREETLSAFRLFIRAGRDEDLCRALDLFAQPEYDIALAYFREEFFTATLNMPWRVRLQNPLGYLEFLAVCLLTWQHPRTGALLDEAREQFSGAEEIPASLAKRLDGEFEVIYGLLAFNDSWTLRQHYENALDLLDGPSVVLCKGTAWSFGSPSVSFVVLGEPGKYDETVAMTERDWYLYRTLSGGLGKAAEKILRAEYHLERGEFADAERLAREALAACRDDRQIASALAASFCLARLEAACGEPEKATLPLEALRPQIERIGILDHLDGLDLALGYIHTAAGRYDAVPEWLRNGEMFDSPHSSLPQLFGFSLTVHCRTILLREEYTDCAATAGDISTCTAPLEYLFARIHGAALKAIAAWNMRNQSAALAFMGEALETSRPDGIILPLAEYGWHIVPLLRRLKHSMPEDEHLDAVLALAERMARFAGHVHCATHLLTPREQEAMRYVAEGNTNQTIAENMGVSAETVKKTLGRAFKKLQATNRTEASRKFAELNDENTGAEAPGADDAPHASRQASNRTSRHTSRQ